jgi:hypothetical protein
MSRTLVTAEELQAWLTLEIQQYKGCEECKAGGIIRLQKYDDHGSNWKVDFLHAAGVPPSIYGPAWQHVLDEARAKFNLK